MIRLTLHLLAQPFVQFATFSGRARRAEFWLFILSLLVIMNVTSLLMESVLRHGNGPHKFAYIEKGMRDGGSFRFEYDGEWRHGEWKHGDKWSYHHHFDHRDDADEYMPDGPESAPDGSGRRRHHDHYHQDHYHQDMSCAEFIAGGEMIAGTPEDPEGPDAPNGKATNQTTDRAKGQDMDQAGDQAGDRARNKSLFCLQTEDGVLITDFTFSRTRAWIGGLLALAHAILLIPFVAVTTRRLHDIGRSGYWQFFYLLPLVGWGIMLVFLLTESTPRKNRYGPKPF